MILYFAQTIEKRFVQHHKKLPGICLTRYFKTKYAFFLLSLKIAVFWKVVSIDFLRPNELISQLAQNLSEYIVEPDDFLLNVCHIQYYEKKNPFFSPGK